MADKTYMLIHGGWASKRWWAKLERILTDRGIRCVSIDLPGHGDKRSLATVSMTDYVSEVVKVVKERNLQELVLVGHSMAGVVISKVAERIPQRVTFLIYLAGFVLEDGESMLDALPTATSTRFKRLAEENPGRVITMPADSARNYFLNRANDQDVRWALNALQPQPFQPFADRMDMKIFYQLTVPKLFVLGKDDHALPMEYWFRFAHRLGCQPVEIDSDHSPMISHPKLLADILVGG